MFGSGSYADEEEDRIKHRIVNGINIRDKEYFLAEVRESLKTQTDPKIIFLLNDLHKKVSEGLNVRSIHFEKGLAEYNKIFSDIKNGIENEA